MDFSKVIYLFHAGQGIVSEAREDMWAQNYLLFEGWALVFCVLFIIIITIIILLS